MDWMNSQSSGNRRCATASAHAVPVPGKNGFVIRVPVDGCGLNSLRRRCPVGNGGTMHRENARHDLAEQVRRLEASRQQHVTALAQIDQLLSHIGDALRRMHVGQARPTEAEQSSGLEYGVGDEGAEAPSGRLGPRRYRKAELTGEQSVLALVRRQGSATTAEINRQWRGEGRG